MSVLALAIILIVISSYYGYYCLVVAQRPRIHAGNKILKKFLKKRVPTLRKKFYPSPLFWDGRFQTILGLCWQRVTNPELIPYTKRELLDMSDGGIVALDYFMADSAGAKQERPVLVIFIPGLNSSSQANYVRTLVQSVNNAGASIVVLNPRGVGSVPFKAPRTYCSPYIADLEEVASYIKKKFSGHRLIGMGTSVGGVFFSKFIICYPEKAKKLFECVIIISIIWDAHSATESLEKPILNKYMINRGFIIPLISHMENLIATFKNPPFPCNVRAAREARTLREYDTAWHAPQFGFRTVEDYYDDASCVGQVHKYSIPVFALNAWDDPSQPGKTLPINEAEDIDSKLALVVTSRGGHLGFVEGIFRKSEHYMERVVWDLVQAIRLHGGAELLGNKETKLNSKTQTSKRNETKGKKK